MPPYGEIDAVAERVDARLAASAWDTGALEQTDASISAAAEVAVFALKLAGKRRQAHRGGRCGRLIVGFALAACVALTSFAAACDAPSAAPEATQAAISQLPTVSGASAAITAQPRASPAQFADLVLLDASSTAGPWAVLVPRGGDVPVLVDPVGAGLDTVGGLYRLAAQPVAVGTRDGPSQFLDPLQPAEFVGNPAQVSAATKDTLTQRWGQDERYLAATRAIAGQPTVLDAAYNAEAAAVAGGTHTYMSGVVLRVEPDKPVLQVVDRALLESGRPTRAEDVVYVAIRASERSLYDPGQVVNLRDVVMDRQTTDVNGQSTTVYVANAALDGARVEPTSRVDLQSLLQPRLARVDQDLAAQGQVAASAGTPAAAAPASTSTPGALAPVQQPVIVQQRSGFGGPSFVDDFLIFMWLSNSGFYRGGGGTTIINNPPFSPNRPSGDVYYSAPPAPTGTSPSTIASSQAASRSTALEAARSSVSGQSSGTGGGVAATNKSAADATARVSAATSKSASVAGDVSSASVGKSTASVASSAASSTASRSAGSVSAGTRGSAGVSSSSGGKGIGGSSGGFGGKGISGGGSSS